MARYPLILASLATLAAVPAGAQTFTGPRVEAHVGYDAAQADGAPGTITGIQPRFGIAVYPCFFTFSAVIAIGALPLALSP